MENYSVRSPVLFLIFNRPDITFHVFSEIKKARPSRLYIAADGPRANHPADADLCTQARSITNEIDWNCEVHTHFQDNNKGCKVAVSSAINWFFDHEEEGIVLEDDCLPANSFFFFCDSLLERFRTNERIFSITGTNLQMRNVWGTASYYFSQYSNVWGWASWRRVWKNYDVRLEKYDEAFAEQKLKEVLQDEILAADWFEFFKRIKSNRIDTWDYQLICLTFFENGLCATPNVNLISNIGFRADATHTPNPLNHNANLPLGEIDEIIHTDDYFPQREADYFFLNKEYNLDHRRKKMMKDKLLRRQFKRWVRGLFKQR